MDKKLISSRQFMIIVTLYSIGSTVLFIPTSMASYAKHDGWIAPLFTLIIGLFLIWLYTKVGALNPEKTFTESMEIILGKWLGVFFSFNFILFCLITAAELVWYVGYFINTQFMGDTPMWFTHIIFVSVIVYAVRKGIEPIVRTAQILFAAVMIILIFSILSILPSAEIKNIQPFLAGDIRSISAATYYCLSIITLPCVVLLTVFPIHIKDTQRSKTAFFIGYGISACIVFSIVLVTIMVLGDTISSNMLFSSFWLIKRIHIFEEYMHLEVIIAIAWLVTIFYRILFYFYGSVIGLSNILKLKDYRFITLPMGIILVVFSLIFFPSIVYANNWEPRVWTSMALAFGFLLPLLILIVGSIKNKMKRIPKDNIHNNNQ